MATNKTVQVEVFWVDQNNRPWLSTYEIDSGCERILVDPNRTHGHEQVWGFLPDDSQAVAKCVSTEQPVIMG